MISNGDKNTTTELGALREVAWASRPCISSAKKRHGRDAHATCPKNVGLDSSIDLCYDFLHGPPTPPPFRRPLVTAPPARPPSSPFRFSVNPHVLRPC